MKYKMEIYFKKESENIPREYAILLGNQIYWFCTLTNLDFYSLRKIKHNQDFLIMSYNKILTLNTKENKITEVNSAIVLQLLNNATKQNLKRILNSTSYMGTKRNVTPEDDILAINTLIYK